jgi:hypothetical protein
VRLICSAADEPERLYIEGEGTFEFERTASRLREMQAARLGRRPRLTFLLTEIPPGGVASQKRPGAAPPSDRVQVKVEIHFGDRPHHPAIFGGFDGGEGAVHVLAQRLFQEGRLPAASIADRQSSGIAISLSAS